MAPTQSVLVVEDDEGIRNVFRLALEMDGYRVFTSSNGREALEKLKHIESVCLILLDLMMPVMNGWEFAKALEKDETLAKIPIVVVTAFRDESKGINAVGFIKKPIELQTLLSVVRHVCQPSQ
jgi:CheY-like chemotaxis protein